MRRRGWKKGEWLVRDEESGFIEYGSKVRRDYYGVLKRKDQADYSHPQDFIRAKQDPFTQFPQNPPIMVYDTSAYNVSAFVYGTNIPTPLGPATHLFGLGAPPASQVTAAASPAIPDMSIGSDFQVY